MIHLRISAVEDVADAGSVAQAVDVLRAGGIVAYPTETLYGLAVDPQRADAVERLYEAKGRDASVAIPIIASSFEQAESVVRLGGSARKVAEAFWPGPLTIVATCHGPLAPRVMAGGTTVAVRVSSHPVARALAAALGSPITATSANRSGQPPAITAADVVAHLAESVDLLLDAGTLTGGRPSTIVEMAETGPRLIRAGAIAWDRVLRSLE
jgi:L-threonylcarbamoyladenylate synthase